MKSLSVRLFSRQTLPTALTGLIAAIASGPAACHATDATETAHSDTPVTNVAQITIASKPGTPRPPFTFSRDDDAFLDSIQRGVFNYFQDHANKTTGMIPDRTSGTHVSTAGVGFQLAALCIGAERGWVSKADAQTRTLTILKALEAAPDNKKFGLFYHFIDGDTAGQPKDAPEQVVSTIDSALLFSGFMVASSYFGGEVATRADQMLEKADWSAFVLRGDAGEAHSHGCISLGWKPAKMREPLGAGEFLKYAWIDCGDEHRLVSFLAVGGVTDPARAVEPAAYYRLRRQLGTHADLGPIVWFPWSGSLFVSFFAQCFIDYAAMGPDDPSALGVPRRARVDWWENARRTVVMHRLKAIENPKKLAGFGPNAWGLTAGDRREGYQVPHLFPKPIDMPGAVPGDDYAIRNGQLVEGKEDWGDGTIATYGAGCSVMFEPTHTIAALRHYAQWTNPDGKRWLWRGEPSKGGYGLVDSFNPTTGWVSPDDLAIDGGPMIVAIENARSGLVWELFNRHPIAKRAAERLKFQKREMFAPGAAGR